MINYQIVSYNSNGNYSREGIISNINMLNFKQIPNDVSSIRIQGVISQDFGEAIVSEHIYKIGKIVSKEEIKDKFGENSSKFKFLLKENAQKALLTRENEVYPYKNGKCSVDFIDENNIDEKGYLHGKIGQSLLSTTNFVRFEYENDFNIERCEEKIDGLEIENIQLPKKVRKAIIFSFTPGKTINDRKIYYFGEFYSPERIKYEFPNNEILLKKAEQNNGLCRFNLTTFHSLTHPANEITFLNPSFINKDGFYRPYEDKSYINLE